MSQEQQQKTAMGHEEFMALHKNNGQLVRHGPDRAEQQRLLDSVTESELKTEDPGLENLKAKDFPLANFDEDEDTHEFKFVQEILNVFSKSRHPHPRSGLQGLSRAWATGDPGDRLSALGLEEFARDEAYLLGTFSRSTRGEGMLQQETSGKMISESHAIRESSDTSGAGGIRGWLNRR